MNTNTLTDIRDIKGLVPVPQSFLWLWILLVVVVVVGAVLWWVLRRKKPLLAPPVIPVLAPFEVAMAALQRLWEQRPDVEPFYTQLSDIVRRYLEEKFRLRAPERTTEEFLREVSRGSALTQSHQALLAEFLQEADMVKFAKYRPAEADMKRAFEAAQRFVTETK